MSVTAAERREVEKLCEESSDGYVRVRCDVLDCLVRRNVSVGAYRFAVVVAFLLGIAEGWLLWGWPQ